MEKSGLVDSYRSRNQNNTSHFKTIGEDKFNKKKSDAIVEQIFNF